MTRAVGILLAAGSGSRMGGPKALVADERGSWLLRACSVLRDGGCDDVIVVIGASATDAQAVLDGVDVDVVEATDWRDGMSASLRAGLERATHRDADAALIHLVDLPDVGPDVVRRIASLAAPSSLARATYDETPGHPVLIGRDHWSEVIGSVAADRGARDFLAAQEVMEVDCSDLASGRDIDRPPSPPGPMLGR